MPTIEQIRAARALLDWSQSDLAEHAGLSQTGIARIENGTNKPNSSTLEKINSAFDQNGIEFLNTSGVQKREHEIRVYEGSTGFIDFLKDVHKVVEADGAGTEVVANNVSEEEFYKWEGDFAAIHEKKMQELGAKYKIITQYGDTNSPASAYAEYRWAKPEIFSYISYYIYCDRSALIDFDDDNVTVYVIHSQAIADFYRHEFDKVWKSSESIAAE